MLRQERLNNFKRQKKFIFRKRTRGVNKVLQMIVKDQDNPWVLHPWSILYVCVASLSFIHTSLSCNLFDFNFSFMLFQQQAFDPLFQNHHTHIYMERLNKINQIDMEKRQVIHMRIFQVGPNWSFNMFAFSLGWLSIPSIFQEVRRQNAMMELRRD
jgi:hypothetical protein